MKAYMHTLFALFIAFTLPLTALAGEAPMSVEGATTVDAVQAKTLFDDGALFIDPRRVSEYEAGRIPDAVNLEMKSAFSEDSIAAVAKKDQPVVFYCNGPQCLRSSECAVQAVAWGYTKVYYLRDGFPAWRAAGYPVE